MVETPSISVIVPAHKGDRGFRECLASVQALSPPPDEVLVVVDGAAEEPMQIARDSGATVLSTRTASGPAKARNLAAGTARGDILFFIDADVAIHPDATGIVRRLFAADRELDAVIGSYDDAPAEANFVSQYRNLLHHHIHQTSREEASTFWGACGAIRREVFLGCGGLDEVYAKPSIEDVELGYRLRRTGHRIMLCKDLQCKHFKRWTARSVLSTDFFDRAVPWTQLIVAHRGMLNDLNLRWGCRLSVVAVFVLLGCAIAGVVWPWLWAGAAVSGITLVGLNHRFYGFLARKRGVLFALGAMPWHWLHYLESGTAFVIGVLTYPASASRAARKANFVAPPTLMPCSHITESGSDVS